MYLDGFPQKLLDGYAVFSKQAPGEWEKVKDHARNHWQHVTFVVIICVAAYFKGGQLAMIYTAGGCFLFYQIYGQTQKVFEFMDLKGMALPIIAILHGISRGTLESYVTAYIGFLFLVREFHRGKEVKEENGRLEGLLGEAQSLNVQQKQTIDGFNDFFQKWNEEVNRFYANNTDMLNLWKDLKEKIAPQPKNGEATPAESLAITLESLKKIEEEIKKDVAGKVAELTIDVRKLIQQKSQILATISDLKTELAPLNAREKTLLDKTEIAVGKLTPAVETLRQRTQN